MVSKTHFHYRTLQQIKSQEYERFFQELNSRSDDPFLPHLNHLGEVKWMTKTDAEKQHEFFEYVESPLLRLKLKQRSNGDSLSRRSPDEAQQVRLQFRCFLEKKYLGRIQPATLKFLSVNDEDDISWDNALSDEEIENIPVTLEIFKSAASWNKFWLAGIAAVLVLIAAGLFYSTAEKQIQTGSLIVESNVNGAEVYLDGEKKGYADFKRALDNISPGKHQIALRKTGFNAIPEIQEIEVAANQSQTIFIRMEPIEDGNQGYLLISADYADSKIFINNDYYGTIDLAGPLPLHNGEYNVTIERAGYKPLPEFRVVEITTGDTARLNFQQIPAGSGRAQTAAISNSGMKGVIDITANVSGARIFINNKDSGRENDYLFTDLPLGKYSIKLVREGYRSVPPEHALNLTAANPEAELSFTLVKEVEEISIRTNPSDGEIFIDGHLRGKGLFEDRLKSGKYTVSFGDLPGFRTPLPREIRIKPDIPIEIAVKYFPEVEFAATVTGNGNVDQKNSDLVAGYILENRGFIGSSKEGPPINFEKDLNDYSWKLGFAFPYRDPKGSHALRLNFTLPRELNYKQSFTLMLAAASSKNYYPHSTDKNVNVIIRFNGHLLSDTYQPKRLEDLNGVETLDWDVTPYIKSGINHVEISTGADNDAYYYVKTISVRN